MKDFQISKIYTYAGPNFYLPRKAVVFNLYLQPNGPKTDFYKEAVLTNFPELADDYPEQVVDLFAKILLQVSRMEMNLFINHYSISRDTDEYVVAIEYLDKAITKEVIYFVSDWFTSINNDDKSFNFRVEFDSLQQMFGKTLFGGPTIYSLIEAGLKRNIDVKYLYEENQFQWGYGKKQHRGRSTIFHTDGIKDTEFTQYKDMVGEFLEMMGFPTPKGLNCFSEHEIINEAKKLGFPCVVKPVAGHKGQGVTTGIESLEEVSKAYNTIIKSSEEAGVPFEGALIQQQIYGYDHRILTVGGKFAACLKRIPAYVVGDGQKTITELIAIENGKEVRLDNARSPLAKIHFDEDMQDFLKLKGMTGDTIPQKDEEVVLRRVANISAGGVSVNVTNEIHQKNIELVEDIASLFNVTAMGIDVLAADIAKPWEEGNFGIIEINAGPGVFMHLAPAEGGSVDIPAIMMNHFFGEKEGSDRIPIIVGNNLSDEFIELLQNKLL